MGQSFHSSVVCFYLKNPTLILVQRGGEWEEITQRDGCFIPGSENLCVTGYTRPGTTQEDGVRVMRGREGGNLGHDTNK